MYVIIDCEMLYTSTYQQHEKKHTDLYWPYSFHKWTIAAVNPLGETYRTSKMFFVDLEDRWIDQCKLAERDTMYSN